MEGENFITNTSSSSEESAHSISILLVDYDLTCLSVVSAMLKKFNYQVVMARHPQDALYTLRLKEGAFDLVVSDVQLPDMDGFEFQKAIAQEFHLPVVLMSAGDQDGIAWKGLDHGGVYFIPKPVSADNLRDLWRFASTNKKRQVTAEQVPSLPEPETSSEKINLDEIIISDSSDDDQDIDVETDLRRTYPKKRVYEENKEVSESSSPKKPKLVWTNTLHNHFLEAIRKIGLDRAVPKKILEVMGVPGLTRENVASHLQKYRIFLRKVADASLEIPHGHEESLSRRFITRLKSSGSNSSTSILHKFSDNNHQNIPWRFPGSNLLASSSSILRGSTYARILANKGNLGKPNVTSSILVSTQVSDRSCVGFGESSSNQTVPTTSLGSNLSKNVVVNNTSLPGDQNIGTSSNSVSVEPSKSFAHRSNFVGYSISNLQHLAESGKFVQSGVVDLPNAEIQGNINDLSSEANFVDEYKSFDDFLDKFLADSPPPSAVLDNNNSEKQILSHVVADFQKEITNPNPFNFQNGMENGSSLFDLDDFDFIATQQSLDGAEICRTTLPEYPACFENQEQAYQDYQCHVSQEIEATPQLGETHRSLHEQQARTNADHSNSLKFNGASSHLNNIYLSQAQVDDEEFLDSLFINFPGENQTFDGI